MEIPRQNSAEDASRFTTTVNGVSMHVTEVFIKEALGIRDFGSLKIKGYSFRSGSEKKHWSI